MRSHFATLIDVLQNKFTRVVDLTKGSSFSDPLEVQVGPEIGTIEKP